MSMIKHLLVFSLLASHSAFADKYFVEPARGSGVPESDRESVEELVRMSVPQAGPHSAVSKREEADYILSPSIMKLGDAYVLSIQKKSKAGNTIFGEKMKAAAMSEMDNVSTRLTKAVITQTQTGESMDVTNVSQEEENANIRRTKVTRHWVFGLGPGWSTNLNSSGGGFTFLLGYNWGLDPHFSITLNWMINNGPRSDSSKFNDFSLGGEYNFSPSKFSPFVGVRLGWGGATVNTDKCVISVLGCGDTASGWLGGVTAGLKMFRTSSVNAAFFANYSMIFDKTSLGTPGLTALMVAVYF